MDKAKRFQNLKGAPVLKQMKDATISGQRDQRAQMLSILRAAAETKKRIGDRELVPKFLRHDYVGINPRFYNIDEVKDIIKRSIKTENGFYTGKVTETDFKQQTACVFGQNMKANDKGEEVEQPIPLKYLQLIDPTDNAPSEVVFFDTKQDYEDAWDKRTAEVAKWNELHPNHPQTPPPEMIDFKDYHHFRVRFMKWSLVPVPFNFEQSGKQALSSFGPFDIPNTQDSHAEHRSFFLDDPFAMPFPKDLRF